MILKRIARLYKALKRRDLIVFPELKIDKINLGDQFAQWTIHPMINDQSTIYSFGVGDNISFDLALEEEFKCKIFLFDPTPRSIEWLKKQNLSSNFSFFPFGLADYDGYADFVPPKEANHVSYSYVKNSNQEGNKTNLEVKKLSTIMKELGDNKIDILKMDIEGAEYDVIENIIADKIDIHQILVEFHHRMKGIGAGKTRNAIRLLKNVGYKIFSVSANGEEFSFIKT